MTALPALSRLVAALERLPGIGPKSARRIAHFLLVAPQAEAAGLSGAVLEAREKTRTCSVCHALTEEDPCALCTDPSRDGTLLAVVEEPFDVEVLERTREFRGRYHVLGGALAPLRGIGPDDLHVTRPPRAGGRGRRRRSSWRRTRTSREKRPPSTWPGGSSRSGSASPASRSASPSARPSSSPTR